MWSVDARGSLTPTRQYRRKGEITSAVFCVMPAATVVVPQTASQLSVQSVLSGQRKAENKQASSPAFFFGTDRGAVVYADDLGHCTDVQQLTASIDTMLFSLFCDIVVWVLEIPLRQQTKHTPILSVIHK